MRNILVQIPVGFKNRISEFVVAVVSPQDQAVFIVTFWKASKLTVT
ncbi:hypothetical protein ANCCAN_02905 [Ancylostoma caninum]|uniref:Uncharacterized protein n=1 Tax=Ancylostoma caninum TaxID=29170 RepID=A0A368H2R5_ANCCA|nr:hypothetical protein ANCCAN_02905 [Ancylostoma caninum]